MKVIFLDIDGVLNSQTDFFELGKYGHPINEGYKVLNRGCLALLQQLMEDTDADVVISSTWRYIFTVEEIHAMFVERGFQLPVDRFVGKTCDMRRGLSDHHEYHRGREIRQYLTDYPVIEKFVILDDYRASITDEGFIKADLTQFRSSDENFINTDEYAGLTYIEMKRAAGILGLTQEAQEREDRLSNLLGAMII